MKKYVIILLVFISISSITFASDSRVSLGYIYNSSKSHTEIVNNTNGNINTVSPTCFDINLQGHLEINNIFDQEFVEDMHEKNILVTPFLSNHWGRKRAQKALASPEILADEVVEAIIKYNLDGVNVDLENLSIEDKDKLTNFVKILSEKLPQEKILSVAVAANPDKLTKTWVAAYDYENLAKYADYLVLMAYDEHSSGGDAGPVASIDFVENSIKAVLESVSRDKIVLGIPLYGRLWDEEAKIKGEAIVMGQVERIASRYKNSVPVYNEKSGSTSLVINVEESEKKAYVNGRYLNEGEYTIWYENEKTILRKLELMNKYGLKGAGLGAWDNENEEFWNYYEKGFENNNYESEATIKERVHYEQVEMLLEGAKSLKLEGELIPGKNSNDKEINEKLFEINSNHLIQKKFTLGNHLPYSNKVITLAKHFKKLDKFTIAHTIKRYSQE